MIDLAIAPRLAGAHVANTEIPFPKVVYKDEVNVASPFIDEVAVNFPESYKGQEIKLICTKATGKAVVNKEWTLKKLLNKA